MLHMTQMGLLGCKTSTQTNKHSLDNQMCLNITLYVCLEDTDCNLVLILQITLVMTIKISFNNKELDKTVYNNDFDFV